MGGIQTPGERGPATEVDGLRRTTRDLVALTTLPAIWAGMPLPKVIESLAGVLMKMLEPDLAYIRLAGRGELDAVEVIRCRTPGDEAHVLAAARALLDRAPTAIHDADAPLAILQSGGDAPLRTGVARFGITGDIGAILVASSRADFPSENERLLLNVAANQAAGVLQRQLSVLELKRSESRFLQLADAAPAMLWVTEPDGSCSFLSRGWYEFTGQKEDGGLVFGWTDVVHPDERERARETFVAANERREDFHLEVRMRHADGSYRWVIDAGRPRYSETGEFLGFVGNVLDINDRKRVEQALHETRELLSAVFDALPVGVAVAGKDGKVLLSNREMHRYLPTNVLPSLDEARHERWQAFHDDGRSYTRQDFPGARALRGERVVPGIEALYRTDDGDEIWTQISAVPLKDAHGAASGQVSIVTNIDQFKRTEAALRQSEAKQRALFEEVTKSNRNLSEFLAVLAHELRNPLAPILTGLEIMRLRSDSAETVGKVRGTIERQVKQLSHLISDLLDIARVTHGKIELRKESVDLKSIVSNAVETSLPLIEKGHHEFSLKLHDAPLPIHADPTRVAQVVGNLLANAAKYTPHGGSIRLIVGREGDEAVVSVTDNGIGIAPESLDTVFDMFSQVGRNTDHSQGGLGIGLSLVRKLVSMHGGTVAATSEGAGRGSTFTVRLPLDAGRAATRQVAAGSAAAAAAEKTFRILVVDDNVDAATTLCSLLEIHGHELRVAHGGQQALQLAVQFRPDVVFLDIGMPDMTGYEVARRVRAIEGLERSVIVAVSGWGAKDDLARSKRAGFDKHFTKPVAPSHLEDFLRSLQ